MTEIKNVTGMIGIVGKHCICASECGLNITLHK
jgi:hypothetical protein